MEDFKFALHSLQVRMEQIAISAEAPRVKADQIRIAFGAFEKTCEILGCIVPVEKAVDLADNTETEA